MVFSLGWLPLSLGSDPPSLGELLGGRTLLGTLTGTLLGTQLGTLLGTQLGTQLGTLGGGDWCAALLGGGVTPSQPGMAACFSRILTSFSL